MFMTTSQTTTIKHYMSSIAPVLHLLYIETKLFIECGFSLRNKRLSGKLVN